MTNIDEKNFGNIVLNSAYSGNNQSLYGSSLYGTFFDVYGNFEVNADGSISAIDLKLMNYKGLIDLAFDTATKAKCTYEKITDNNNILLHHLIKLEFTVKSKIGGSSSYTRNVDLDSSMNAIKDISKNEKMYLQVIRNKKEMWPQTNGDNPMQEGVFDNEFFYRDGSHYVRRQITEVPAAFYLLDQNKLYPHLDLLAKPGLNCGIGNNKVTR